MKVLKLILYSTIAIGIGLILYFGYNYLQLLSPNNSALRTCCLGLLFGVVLTVTGLIGLLTQLEKLQYTNIRTFSIFVTPLLICSLITAWVVIANTGQIYDPEATVLTNQKEVNTFIASLKKEEPFELLPTGIFLYSLDFPKPDHISFSGYIWQKYDTESQKNLSRGIRLPEAIELKSHEAYKETENNKEIVGWDIDATLFQEHDYSLFPFDIRRVEIPLAHKTFGKNIVLVPDFSDYTAVAPQEKKAIDTEYNIPGFTIEKTYFSFEPAITETTFGLTSYKNIKKPIDMVYNVIISRNFINAFILYLLPLIVILLSLFAVFLVSSRKKPGKKPPIKNVFKPLGPYVGLFFTLVFLHRFLRSQYSTGGLMYIEYFIFFTYITLLLLVLHACTLTSENYLQKRLFPLFKPLFWPIQLGAWLIVTLIVFFP